MTKLTLGYSPCPNDTFIFHHLIHGGGEAGGLFFKERLEDVETLNRLVLGGDLDISKISCHLLGHVREQYCLLRSGGALGRGCGPLVIARTEMAMGELRGKPIALPGRYTTAALLLRLFDPTLEQTVFMPFHDIIGAVSRGEVAAGVVIHESRFTFRDAGLCQLLDLGDWWEKETGHPIPLGGIVVRRSLGARLIGTIDRLLEESVAYAMAHPREAEPYIRAHSQEMSSEVCAAHIALYVNHFSLRLGKDGENAVQDLVERAEGAGIVPRSQKRLFCSE